MFIILHWPAYIIRYFLGEGFNFSGILIQSFLALTWGLIFIYMLRKSESLMNPIIAHSLYDILLVIFIG